MRAGRFAEAAACPRRERAERVVPPVDKARARDERIVGDDVDVLRSGPICSRGDRREKLAMFRLAVDDERVAVSDREGRFDDRVGVAG